MEMGTETRLKHDIEHLSSVDDICLSTGKETISDYSSWNLINSLGTNLKHFGLFSSWFNKTCRWQRLTEPPKNSNNKLQKTTLHNPTSIAMSTKNPIKPHSKTFNSCSIGSKRRTIYGGTLASTFSVFLIQCLIVATAYDDKFVNKL